MALYETNFPKPQRGWKNDLAFSLSPRVKKECKPLKRTPIKMIGKKKSLRLKMEGSETDVFDQIWKDRPHTCEICSKFIPEQCSFCFAHILAKGLFPKYRYYEKNIALVCSIACHAAIDKKYQTVLSRVEFEKTLIS